MAQDHSVCWRSKLDLVPLRALWTSIRSGSGPRPGGQGQTLLTASNPLHLSELFLIILHRVPPLDLVLLDGQPGQGAVHGDTRNQQDAEVKTNVLPVNLNIK